MLMAAVDVSTQLDALGAARARRICVVASVG